MTNVLTAKHEAFRGVTILEYWYAKTNCRKRGEIFNYD